LVEEKPGIYLLFGEDDLSIAQAIAELQARLGDPTTVALNRTIIEAREFDLDLLKRTASAMPFLAERRVVVVKNAAQKITTPAQQEKFGALLLDLPLTTAVFLVEDRLLRNDHWLVKWAEAHKGRVFLRKFSHENTADLAAWIRDQAQRQGGRMTPTAASALAAIVGNDTYYLNQEIQKLLAYVNYSRAIDEEDVNAVTVGPLQSNVFAMVDALSRQDGKQALGELQRLLDMEDPIQILGMIVRQFRLLIMTVEVLQGGGSLEDVVRRVGVRDFVAKKLIPQARRLSSAKLEQVYHHLLELDRDIKTGLIEDRVGMDVFVADFTTRSE